MLAKFEDELELEEDVVVDAVAPDIVNFCPTYIRLAFLILLSLTKLFTVVPYFLAIALRVSPFFTV